MPVWLSNLQRGVPVRELLLKLHSSFLLHAAGAGRFDVSVVCVDGNEMRALNRAYRSEDCETDVLAFPYYEDLVPGSFPQPERDCDYNLGDIILCPAVVEGVCRGEGVRLEQRLPVIVTHGLCHLIGHRHGTQEELHKMNTAEGALLTTFNTAFGTNLKPITDLLH